MAGVPTPAHPAAHWIFSVLVVNFYPFCKQPFAGLDPYFQLLRSSSAISLPLGSGNALISLNFISLWLEKTQIPKKLWSIAWKNLTFAALICLEQRMRVGTNQICSSVRFWHLQLQVNQGFPQLCKRRRDFRYPLGYWWEGLAQWAALWAGTSTRNAKASWTFP